MASGSSSSSGVIELFNPKDTPFGELSNNAKTPISTGTERWPTVTNYIYGMMLTNPNYRLLFMDSGKALPTKDVATVFNEYWKKTNLDVISAALEVAIAEKFRRQATDKQQALLQLLLSTVGNPENPTPIHYMSQNMMLGVGPDNDGNNLYGRHLAVLRDRIIAERANIEHVTQSSAADANVYKTYMVLHGLKKALREGNDSELSAYKGRRVDDLYTEMKGSLHDISKDAVISMYRSGGLDSAIDYTIQSQNNSVDPLIAAARKAEIRNHKHAQKTKRDKAILAIYATYILSKEYPELPAEDREEAMNQQFDKLGYLDMHNLLEEVWTMYEKEQFDDTLQAAMTEAAMDIHVPDTETVLMAEAAANYPEISSPSGSAMKEKSGVGVIVDLDAPYVSIQRPKKPELTLTPDDDIERLTKQKQLSSDLSDNDILSSILDLERSRETYMLKYYNKSESSKERHESKQMSEDLLLEINKLYNTASPAALQKMLDTLDESYARDVKEIKRMRQEVVNSDNEVNHARQLGTLLQKANTTKERSAYVQERLGSQYQNISDKAREYEKAEKKAARDGTPPPPPPKAGVAQLVAEREGAIKIYERARHEDDPGYMYRHLSPLCCNSAEDMLIIDGRSYPTIMHYVLVRRLASIPSIKTVRNAYPMLCKKETNCKPSNTSAAWSAMDDAYTRDPRNFKDIPTLDALYMSLCNQDYDKRIVEITAKALDLKFKNRRLQDLLLLTGSDKLEWADRSDKIIGIGPKGEGQNFVGKYLMTLRDYFIVTRDDDDIHVLTENDVAQLLVGDEFLNHWLKMRIRDMCRVINVVKSYLYMKDGVSPPNTAKFVRSVLDNVYQPCSHLYQLSDLVTVPIPDYFRRIITACPGFTGRSEDEEDEDEDYASMAMADIMRKADDVNAKYKAAAKAADSRSDPIVDVIWKRLAVMIHMVIKSQDRPTAMNAKQVIGNATRLLAKKTPCIRIVRDDDTNCTVSAILNVMKGLNELNEKLHYSQKIVKQDVEAASSIILDRDLLDELEPITVEEQVFVHGEDEEDIVSTTRHRGAEITPARDANIRDILAITTRLRRDFEDDVDDPDEIAALILGGVDAIRTYPASESVKQGRINFFATLR